MGRIALAVCVTCAVLALLPGVSRADLLANVPEAADYSLVYQLDIPSVGNLRDANSPPYSVNNAASTKLYDRVAYYLELDTGSGSQWVYASMDAFDSNASKIGLPHNVLNPVARQQTVSNMNVLSNVAGITTGTGISTGSVEMWPSNYGGAPSGYVPTGGSVWDWNDSGFSTGAGYGSFQVHNYDVDGAGPGTAGQTVFAYNRWGTGGNSDLGIGNRPAQSNTDWTFAQNAAGYTVKDFQVLVHEIDSLDRPYLPDDLPDAPAQIQANVAEAASYKLVYQLPITSASAFDPSQYTVDNSAAIADGSFGRIAYYMELESAAYGQEHVWVSMDAFNLDASLIGVPNTTEHIQQMIVNNMNVEASAGSGVTDAEGISGNIEFWNTNYSGTATNLIPGGTNSYDFDDYRTPGGYGSMQIHNYLDGETLFAFNRWNSNDQDLGIGNDPSTGRGNYNPDYTFWSQTYDVSSFYTSANLYVLVEQVQIPEPSTFVLTGLGLVGLVAARRRKRGR